jgi:G3E family GTPase
LLGRRGWHLYRKRSSKCDAPLPLRVSEANLSFLRYGIGSFVYRARKPFHPERFYDFFKGKFHLFQRREEDEDGDGSEAGDKSDSKLGSEFDSDVDDDSDGSDDETNAKLEILEKGHASNESTPPTSVSSGKNEDSTDECEEDQSLTTIIENKRADPLLAGIYRLKGFIWLASRPKMTGEISAAGAILTVAGFQEWHAERVFGSCKPCLEIRDPQPIKELMGEMLQRQYEQPWLQISQKGRTVRRKVERFLHGCYYSTAEIKSWFAIVDDKATSEEDREEKLEEFLLDRFEDLNLEYIYLICKDFQKWGDRRQEVVFIGEKLDAAGLTAKLDACLLTDEEMLEWEAIMENDGLDKGAASMLKRAERRLKAAGPDISEEKREKLEDKVAEGRFYVAQAKEEKLEQRWNDDTWAEWTVDEGHDHEHDGEACELA